MKHIMIINTQQKMGFAFNVDLKHSYIIEHMWSRKGSGTISLCFFSPSAQQWWASTGSGSYKCSRSWTGRLWEKFR